MSSARHGRGRSGAESVAAISLGPLVFLADVKDVRVEFRHREVELGWSLPMGVTEVRVIRKQGGYIPGIRPGFPTERHLQNILYRITLPGALFLAVVALLPSIFLALWNIQNYPFAGTTLLIAVGVALETMKQVDSQLMLRNYEGFLR